MGSLVNAAKQFLRGRVPGQLVIQITDHCNARCPQCGMNAGRNYKRSRLSPEVVRRLIDAAAARGVQAVSFTGGEPLMFLDQLTEYIRYAARAGIPYIRTGTNGFLFAGTNRTEAKDRVRRVADALADTPLRNFWISVDSADPAVHEAMRGFGGLVDGIHRALPVFHRRGIYPSANLGLNRNIGGRDVARDLARRANDPDYPARFLEANIESLRRFYRLVIDLGFTMVNTCYPMSEEPAAADRPDAVYRAVAADGVVRYSRSEKAWLFLALLTVIPSFRPKLRVFSPLVSLYALHRQYSGHVDPPQPCRGGVDFWFVDAAAGDTFPCGYRGAENYGKFWNLTPQRIPNRPECRRCDWECFRDPSEMLGPLLGLRNHPLRTLSRWRRDPKLRRLLWSDIAYYRACRFFDGRRPPAYHQMRRYLVSVQK